MTIALGGEIYRSTQLCRRANGRFSVLLLSKRTNMDGPVCYLFEADSVMQNDVFQAWAQMKRREFIEVVSKVVTG
jgi:hypothetical protein